MYFTLNDFKQKKKRETNIINNSKMQRLDIEVLIIQYPLLLQIVENFYYKKNFNKKCTKNLSIDLLLKEKTDIILIRKNLNHFLDFGIYSITYIFYKVLTMKTFLPYS